MPNEHNSNRSRTEAGRRYGRYFAVPCVLGTVVTAVLVATLAEPLYKAQAVVRRRDYDVLHDQGRGGLTGRTEVAPAVIELELLSDEMLKPVARELLARQAGAPVAAQEPPVAVMDTFLHRLREGISVRVIHRRAGEDYIVITARSRDNPRWCADAVNALAHQYESRFGPVEQHLPGDRATRAETGLKQREANPGKGLPQEGAAPDRTLQDLAEAQAKVAVELQAVQQQVAELEARLAALPETVVEEVTGPNPEVAKLQREIAALQRRLARDLDRMTEEHPRVRSLRDRIQARKEQLAEVPATVVIGQRDMANSEHVRCEADLAEARLRHAELKDRHTTLVAAIQAEREKAQAFTQREREDHGMSLSRAEGTDHQRSATDTTASNRTASGEVGAARRARLERGCPEVRLLQAASVPLHRDERSRVRLALAGSGASAIFGVVLALAAAFNGRRG